MTQETPSAPAPGAQSSPWWQTIAFVAALAYLLLRQPNWAAAIAFLGFVIFIHELGHFLMARWQGMRVETFSLGFGPALVQLKRGETTYQIAAIPLGGYVKPAGEDPKTDEDVANAKPDEFMGRPWWSRSLVLLAGPAMNLIFPVLALFVVYISLGRSYPWGPPQVMEVMPKSAAQEAGLQAGDLIVKVNGQQVNNTQLLASLVDRQSRVDLDKPLKVEVLRGGKALSKAVRTRLNPEAGKYLMGVQVQPSPPPYTTALRSVGVLTPAEKAGFKPGDVLLSVGGEPLSDGFSFNRQFARAAQDPVAIGVSRAGKVLTLTAPKKQPVPEEFDPELLGLLGLEFEVAGAQGAARQRERLGPVAALKAAAGDTATAGAVILMGLKQLISGQLNARESLGGPVAIMRMAAQQAERGWEDLLHLMLNISLTLGILNLLPIPLLDGGTFVFCVIEGIRRKPLKLRTQVVAQNIGFAFIGSLFLFTIANDLLRWAGH
jgi:regulator of sigma E protease